MADTTTTPPETSGKKRGRKPGFDRADTVAKVADLFWARGYDGVAISDVMNATGLSKSSLYNSFGDKDDLFRLALSHYHTNVVAAGAQWLAADDGENGWSKLDALLSGPANDVFGADDRRGCFLCNTASDGISGAPAVNDLVRDGFGQLVDAVAELLSRAAPGATPDQRLNAARMIITTYAGLRVRSRHARTREELDGVRETLIHVIRDSLSHPRRYRAPHPKGSRPWPSPSANSFPLA